MWLDIKWVFGWDPPLRTFYLQKHNALVQEPEQNPILWLGATVDTTMYEVEDLVREAKKRGLDISQELQTELYREKDEGV